MNARHTMGLTALALAAAVLAGCGVTPGAPATSDDPKAQAQKVAETWMNGTFGEVCRVDVSDGRNPSACATQPNQTGKRDYVKGPTLVATDPWRNGYAFSYDMQLRDGPEKTMVIGAEPGAGGWLVTARGEVTDQYKSDPQKVCKALRTC